MLATAPAEGLSLAVRRCSKSVGKVSEPIPAQHLWISARAGELHCTGSNGSTTITCRVVKSEVETEGGVAVLASRLLALVKQLEGRVTLEHQDGFLVVSSGSVVSRIPALPDGAYRYAEARSEADPTEDAPRSSLLASLSTIGFALGMEDSLSNLMVMCFRSGSLIAADGTYLAVCDVPWPKEMCLPSSAYRVITQFLKGIKDSVIGIVLEEGFILMVGNEAILRCPTSAAKFPDVSRILAGAREGSLCLEVPRLEAIHVLQAVGVTTDAGGVVTLACGSSGLVISSEDSFGGKSSGSLTSRHSAGLEEVPLRFQGPRMARALQALTSDTVTIRVSLDETVPAIVAEPGTELLLSRMRATKSKKEGVVWSR